MVALTIVRELLNRAAPQMHASRREKGARKRCQTYFSQVVYLEINLLRNKSDTFSADNDDDWQQARHLFVQAGNQPRRLVKNRLSRDKPFGCQFVIVKHGRQGRRHVNRSARPARGHYSREQARSQREPWLLATSIDLSTRGAAKRVVRAYKTRMQIEEAFRDLKSERFGLGFEASRAAHVQRIKLLLLIAMLALIVAWLIGYCVEAAGHARRYQANTVTKRKVFSAVYLGRRAWRESPRRYHPAQLRQALDAITKLVTNHARGF